MLREQGISYETPLYARELIDLKQLLNCQIQINI